METQFTKSDSSNDTSDPFSASDTGSISKTLSTIFLNTSFTGIILSGAFVHIIFQIRLRLIVSFCRLADEYGLEPVYVKEFHEVFAENEDHAEFGPLLQNMKVVDSNGESHMDEDQWEAASKCVPSPL